MEMTCIVCPNSCRLSIEQFEEGYEVTGNQCKRGYEFAVAECTEPMRMFTSTVCINGDEIKRLPVISSKEVPKNMLFACQKALYGVRVSTPVKCRDIVVENICGTGVDILASRSME